MWVIDLEIVLKSTNRVGSKMMMMVMMMMRMMVMMMRMMVMMDTMMMVMMMLMMMMVMMMIMMVMMNLSSCGKISTCTSVYESFFIYFHIIRL